MLYGRDVECAQIDALLEEGRASSSGVLVLRGEAGIGKSALLEVAEQEGADMIVVGNKGMTGAKRFLLGSVPDKVSHHAPCSVLIVRTS